MSVFTPQTKSSNPAWAPQSKSLAFSDLLKEDGFYLLLETGFKIMLEQSGTSIPWSAQSKSSAAWTAQTKSA